MDSIKHLVKLAKAVGKMTPVNAAFFAFMVFCLTQNVPATIDAFGRLAT